MSFSVRIYKPARNVMQSGRAKTKQWVLEPELDSPRLPEPLMGWQSSKDTNNQIKIYFETQDDAVSFASKKGWHYSVMPEHNKRVQPRNYADNFK